MIQFILVKAEDGMIGPAARGTAEATSYDCYDDAVAAMARDIEVEGGGEFSIDFGTGYARDGAVAYEIFAL